MLKQLCLSIICFVFGVTIILTDIAIGASVEIITLGGLLAAVGLISGIMGWIENKKKK